jgi:hypothetical protein
MHVQDREPLHYLKKYRWLRALEGKDTLRQIANHDDEGRFCS